MSGVMSPQEEIILIQEIGIVFRDGQLTYDVVREWIPTLNEAEDTVSHFTSTGGATIYFSPEVNDKKIAIIKRGVPAILNVILSKGKFNYLLNKARVVKNKLDMKIQTLKNIKDMDKKLIKAGEPVEKKYNMTLMWTRTPANVGYWTSSETGKKVKERSHALHVLGIPIEAAIDFAKEIRKEFGQREVIVVDKEKESSVYSITGDIPGEDAKNTGKTIVKKIEARRKERKAA